MGPSESSSLAAAPRSPPSSSSAAMPVPVRSQSRSGKRTPVPVIIESFPIPPTYIPPEAVSTLNHTSPKGPYPGLSRPLSSFDNPPPSLPPLAPLPPLPGPSPISDHESVLIMSSNRSRRSSKMSIQSSSQSIRPTGPSYASGRSSIETVASTVSASVTGASSPPATTTTFTVTPRRSSIASSRSLRSYSSNGSIASQSQAPHPRPTEKLSTLGYAISEEESGDLSHGTTPLSDKENVRRLPSRREPRRAQIEGSISTADTASVPPGGTNLDSQAQSLHLHMRAYRSKSESHKMSLRSRSTSPSAAGSATSGSTIPAKVPPVPQRRPAPARKRSTSPDIADIISATPRPRPRTRTSSYYSNGSSRDSQSLSRSGSTRRYVSDVQGAGPRSSILSKSASEGTGSRTQSPAELAYAKRESWNDDSFVEDYGTPINRHDEFVPINPGPEAQLDLEESDSDSSLDLHTPLPHLMLRHGLLSPHSKLLPESNLSQPPLPDSRPESMMSVASNASVMTKSGLFKDQRDTPQRRVRHRDGSQLRAGMGLTTGLGWSDSEDEDAPSPLTRRLSTLNLTNRSSSSSLRSSKHPSSRSRSNSTLPDDNNDKEALAASRRRPRPPLPPTSWQRRSASGGASPGGRTSTSSVGSNFSLTLSIPEDDPQASGGGRGSLAEPSTRRSPKSGRDSVDTPSTASTISLPMPVTPDDFPMQHDPGKDKGLPPLPAPRRYPSSLALRTAATSSGSSNEIDLRPRTLSSASSVSSASAAAGHGASVTQSTPATVCPPTTVPTLHSAAMPTPSYALRTARTPRPLRLSQSISANIQPGEPPQRSGQVLTYNRNLHDQQRTRSASGPARPGASSHPSTTPTTPTTPGFSKPMPRTGTGMVYRTSSNPGKPPLSRMRMPGAASQPLSVSSAGSRGVPPIPTVPIPIAL